jgi:Fe-S-cluster-containing dehydrogenase component
MKNWYIIIDIAKCENCNNCFLACKDEHVGNDWPRYAAPQPDHGPKWIQLFSKERGKYPFIDVAYLPSPCMHCGDAPCMKVAKENAIYRRDDGIVIIDPVKVKAQQNVVAACPYHAIWWNEELQIPQKCTMCAHLLDSGWTKTRCVQACPTGALSMLHEEPYKIAELIGEEKLAAYRPELKTLPHVLYKNLYRFTRCFIGGSVAYMSGEKEECAEGAKVTLVDADGKTGAEQVTDSYGDFKFDGLAENSGKYSLTVSFKNYPLKTISIELQDSVYTGVISL